MPRTLPLKRLLHFVVVLALSMGWASPYAAAMPCCASAAMAGDGVVRAAGVDEAGPVAEAGSHCHGMRAAMPATTRMESPAVSHRMTVQGSFRAPAQDVACMHAGCVLRSAETPIGSEAGGASFFEAAWFAPMLSATGDALPQVADLTRSSGAGAAHDVAPSIAPLPLRL